MKSLLLAFALLTIASTASAQKQCVKGIACGNTCIAATKTCRIGTVRTPAPTLKAAAPADAKYVASRRGKVYYWLGCSAWKSLLAANLIHFKTAAEARSAGYRPSASHGCAGPDDTSDGGSVSVQATASHAQVPGTECSVARIIDGDTFDCSNGVRVRLLLIDAPETNQGPFGAVAKLKLEELLPLGEPVTLEFDVEQRDRYGRTLAYVRNGNTFVNRELVRSGVAVVSVYPPNVRHIELMRVAADSAKAGRSGLWSTSAFECLPSDYRQGKCR